MGRDIRMYICQKGKETKNLWGKDNYCGRNSEWFDNMTGNDCSGEYNFLPLQYGISPLADARFQKTEEDKKEKQYEYCFDFRYINVGDFKKWFEEYRPDKKAGWVSTYEAWQIKNNKGDIHNEIYLDHYKDPERGDDQVFIETVDKYDMSRRLYERLKELRVSNKADIFYFFDW